MIATVNYIASFEWSYFVCVCIGVYVCVCQCVSVGVCTCEGLSNTRKLSNICMRRCYIDDKFVVIVVKSVLIDYVTCKLPVWQLFPVYPAAHEQL